MILSGSALLVLFAFVTICGACRCKKVRVGLFTIQIDEGRNVGDETPVGCHEGRALLCDYPMDCREI